MKAILGKKLGMSQVFSEDGTVVPVTLVHALPNSVMLRRTESSDGYSAVQLGLPTEKSVGDFDYKKITKSHPAMQKQAFAKRKEFRLDSGSDGKKGEDEAGSDDVELGSVIKVDSFEAGDTVHVTGTSKGKGFAGVVKRHHFKGGPASHGHRHVLRRPGSIGSQFPQHVFKGKRMAGRMGDDQVTVKNLEIVSVDSTKNVLAIKEQYPGRRVLF